LLDTITSTAILRDVVIGVTHHTHLNWMFKVAIHRAFNFKSWGEYLDVRWIENMRKDEQYNT
jgi:hypothetical protein